MVQRLDVARPRAGGRLEQRAGWWAACGMRQAGRRRQRGCGVLLRPWAGSTAITDGAQDRAVRPFLGGLRVSGRDASSIAVAAMGWDRPPATSAFPSERPCAGSSILCAFLAASKSRRNRRAHQDRFAPWFAATMSVLSPLARGPAWLPLPPHTPISLPSHPAPDRLMEPAHAVYS
jgi:hypothetical protein